MVDYWRYCREFVGRAPGPTRGTTSRPSCSTPTTPTPTRRTGPASPTGRSSRSSTAFSFAGHDPVTALLCNTLLCLLPRREQWDELCADPSLAAAAVEETLRFESSQISWRRITTQDTTLAGVDLPAGTRLYLNFASANHQPDVFDDPETFDIHRDTANRHISFGKGIHFCVGNGLARMEARIALELLSQRLPSLRLAPEQQLSYFPNITFRGPDTLQLEWDT